MSKASEILDKIKTLNERRNLNEMATVLSKSYGFGIEIKIFSEDHSPAHMHVYDVKSGELIGRVIIPSSKPSSINSIRSLGNEELTVSQKKIILNALLVKGKRMSDPIWKLAIYTWEALHPDSES